MIPDCCDPTESTFVEFQPISARGCDEIWQTSDTCQFKSQFVHTAVVRSSGQARCPIIGRVPNSVSEADRCRTTGRNPESVAVKAQLEKSGEHLVLEHRCRAF